MNPKKMGCSLITFLIILFTGNAMAATTLTVDTGWTGFTYDISIYGSNGSIAPDGPLSWTSSTPVILRVTDFLQTGEWYKIYEGNDVSGGVLGTTPDVAFNSSGSIGSNYQAAFDNPAWSSGEFMFGAGSHTITIEQQDNLPGYTVWNVAVRIDSNPIPVPSAITLLSFGLIGLAGISRKKLH
ncbi:MAG: hypothetical protein MI799_14210 [Desulfobacterales bacterium]|nr:hypothetical protein [Desulfobacterales bacterium]